jgi:hypothetical protein
LLGTVKSESAIRLHEVAAILRLVDHLDRRADPLTSTLEATSAKGLFFVHLYAAYEFTVLQGLKEVYRRINSAHIEFKACRPSLLAAALDKEIRSLVNTGSANAWKARRTLFEKVGSAHVVEIEENVDPCAGRNLARDQLESIWDTLRIREPLFPDQTLIGLVSELVQNRVDVAHGNRSASDVGRRYTPGDLCKRHKAIEGLCTHILSTFEDYLDQGHYRA